MESYVEFVPARMARGTIVPDFIMDDERLSAGAIMVYTSLCSYSRNKNFCFPGKETLMHHARCSFNTLQKYLTQLIQYGYLKLTKINNRIFYYLFAPHKETQKNLTCDFTEVSKIETEVKELNNINILTPPTPSSEKVFGRQKKTTNSFEGDFNKFWDCYPRKENKQFAITQFIKLKKKQLLPPFEYFKKSVSFFMNSKQWNRENGRYIPCLSRFLANAKWEEVPMEVFEPKRELSHRNIAESVENATKQWEQQKKEIVNNSKPKEKEKLENIENAWHEFTGKFKPEFGYKQFVAKAKFIELCSSGFSFGVIEENKNITPAEFLQHVKNQKVR